jgi:hypothetical protein
MENNADRNDLPMENVYNETFDSSTLVTMICHILMFLEFMQTEFPQLFGFPPPLQQFSILKTSNEDRNEDEVPLFTLLFWSHLEKLATYSFYHPRASVTSGMWVKHRSRGWFLDFMLQYDDERWLQNFKMSSGAFNWLCNQLAPSVRRMHTNYRLALSIPERVGAVLYKLIWAASTAEVTEAFGIGCSILYDLLYHVIPTIIQVLGHHIAWPGGEALQTTIRENFECSGIPNAMAP